MPTRLVSVVFDAHDHRGLAQWWSDALGWPVQYDADDETVVEPDGNEATDLVPGLVFGSTTDPKVAKNRVHLDLASQSDADQVAIVDRLVAAGAQHVDVGQRDVSWVVLADPEGNEFCVLAPNDRYTGHGPLAAVSVDAIESRRAAAFWAVATGREIVIDADGDARLARRDGAPPDLDFLGVADQKVVKNRVHLDIAPYATDDQAAEVDRLVAAGARRVDIGQGDDVSWVVLADPEGNEFCVLTPRGVAPSRS